MKRLLAAAGLGLLCGLLLLAWGWRQWTAPGPRAADATAQLVRIPAGMTLTAAADSLAERGLLRRAWVLRAGARLTGRGRDLRAGLYRLEPGRSPRDLLAALTAGPTVQVRLTVPEGLDADETARAVAQALDVPAARFLAVADSLVRREVAARGLLGPHLTPAAYDSLLATAGTPKRRCRWSEGYLAPDTYQFAEGTGAAAVAATLVRTQLARLDSVLALPRPAATAGLSGHAVLTLASIVEAEARQAAERPLVAAVYVNRLRRGWRLEADPTVAFLLDKKGERLFYRDLAVSSPYNTYRRAGLPPGPIGGPGLASLLAAARPDTTCDALYFVSDGGTGHVFTRTAAEHEAAVRRFRQVREADRRGGN